jgi:ATP-dependent protease HslVU (ClpYQ) peptidase subunit
MTTIAYKDGVMAADSRCTVGSEGGGDRVFRCEKLFHRHGALIGTAGESGSGLIFVDWYGSGDDAPSELIDGGAEFDCIVVDVKGAIWLFDRWCKGERVLEPFWAVGSGAKAALGAMHAGASAKRAVEIACKIDPWSAPPIITKRRQV